MPNRISNSHVDIVLCIRFVIGLAIGWLNTGCNFGLLLRIGFLEELLDPGRRIFSDPYSYRSRKTRMYEPAFVGL